MWWNRRQLFVIQQPLLCVCLSISVVSLIWCCLSFTSTRISSTMAISATKLALGCEQIVLQAVCSSLQMNFLCWGYTQSVCCLLESRASRVSSRGSCCHCVCSLSEALLRKEPSPAFLAVPVPLSPRRSGGCACGNRRWIRWRERKWASPYLLPFPSDPTPALWVRKPALWFLPPRERARRSACLPPRRWT